MKIGFNKTTLLVIWNLLMAYVLIRGFLMTFGYGLPSKPYEPYEIQGYIIILLASVGFIFFNTVFGKEEETVSS